MRVDVEFRHARPATRRTALNQGANGNAPIAQLDGDAEDIREAQHRRTWSATKQVDQGAYFFT